MGNRAKNIKVGIGLGTMGIGVALFISALIINDQATVITTSPTEAPTYLTVLPQGKTIATLGGWQRVSPTDSDPVYAFADSINGTGITVSEQPLPASFKDDVDAQIAALAKGYDATDQITAGDTTVYIGTNAKGPQSVILTKDNLLILIKSQDTLSNGDWKNYISSLH